MHRLVGLELELELELELATVATGWSWSWPPAKHNNRIQRALKPESQKTKEYPKGILQKGTQKVYPKRIPEKNSQKDYYSGKFV